MSRELIQRAFQQGSSTGQVALGEFILKNYEDQISSQLKSLLEKVLQREYEQMGVDFCRPAEDVALEVSNIMDQVNGQER